MAIFSKFLPPEQTEVESAPKIIKPTQVLLEWEAPERIFVKKSREFYRKIAVIIIFFSILLLIFKEIVFVLVLFAVYFVVYVATSIPPKNVVHKISTSGVHYASAHLYKWDYFKNFFLEKKYGYELLTFNTVDPLPGRLFLILPNDMDKTALVRIVNEYLSIEEEPESTFYEDLIAKIGRKIKI